MREAVEGGVFVEPEAPTHTGPYLHLHEHEWVEVGAIRNENGTWSSAWGCTLCPDVATGGHVGPVPDGYCFRCGWVNRIRNLLTCEECKSSEISGRLTTR